MNKEDFFLFQKKDGLLLQGGFPKIVATGPFVQWPAGACTVRTSQARGLIPGRRSLPSAPWGVIPALGLQALETRS